MKKISRVINLLTCSNLDDFPTHHQNQDAQSLLANWTAAWHPELIAATGSRPLWCCTDQTASQTESDSENPDSENPDIDDSAPYFSDLYHDHDDIDHHRNGDHDGPHAPLPYDGSPFRLPQPLDDEDALAADALWQDSVVLIPTVSTSSLQEGFAASAAGACAAMVAGQTERDEIVERLTTKLDLRTDESIKTWANEFYALGYAWLQVQLLTRKIRYSSNLNQQRFDTALINSARAVVAEDYDTAEAELTTCYDTLMEEKNNYYPVKPDLIDLVLTSPKTLGKSFADEVGGHHHANFQMTGSTIEALAQRSPEVLEGLRQRLADQSASLVGGNQFELPAPLLSKDCAVNQIAQCHQTAKRLLNSEPKVFLRRRAGLTTDLPLLLEQQGFVGALHVSFDRGRVPPSSSGAIQWSGPGDSSIMAKTEAPLDASDAATFLDFAVQFGRQMDSAHSATMMLTHWPGKTQSSFDDLVRISSRSPVLGTFQTLEDHFDAIYDPGYGDRFLADEYRAGYLEEAVRENAIAPISSVASYWNRTWRLTSLSHLNTWIAMASQIGFSDVLDVTNDCDSITQQIHSAQQAIEQETETWTPPNSEIDTKIGDIQTAAITLLRRICNPSADTGNAAILVNPLGFRRRLNATIETTDTRLSGDFTSSQKPFQLSARQVVHGSQTEQAKRQWIMDVDSFGGAVVTPIPTADTSDGRREPDVVVGEKLQNEFFVATIDEKSGGLRSIQFHGKRGNRGGQRIVYRDHVRPNVSSRMVCRSVEATTLSKIGGEITTVGSILMEEQEVADFRQTFRLARGQRHLELEIELTPKVSLPPSAATWFASQLAWQDESCTLHAACQLAKFETVDPKIQSPNFVQISMSDYSLTLLAGGLPWHRRTARCKLDTMLIVGGEPQRKFRIGIGVNISHAARAAIHFDSPTYAIDQLPASATLPNGGRALIGQCLLHLDCKNIISTFSAPVFVDGKLVAVRVRLQETEGRAGRLNISTPLTLEKVVRQNFLGQTDAELVIDDNLHRFGIDFSGHDFLQIEMQF